MTLLQIRTKVIDQSGRRNYVVAGSYADNGADYFIDAASRALDREQETTKSPRWYQEDLAIDGLRLKMQYCRVVAQVWYKTAAGANVQLTKFMYDEMLTAYPTLEETTSGPPLYWAPEPLTASPEVVDPVENLDRHGVILMPPTDAAITVKVFGRFYSKPLALDADINYWSEVHPDILILATMKVMDYSARNSEGERDYAQVVAGLLNPVDRDVAEWDAATKCVMRG